MDQSNFDIIKCGERGCDYWHILITDGFSSVAEAKQEISKIIKGESFYSGDYKKIVDVLDNQIKGLKANSTKFPEYKKQNEFVISLLEMIRNV